MKLCIDPGHGGSDTGATFRGTLEKDIDLSIALYLENMCQSSGTIDTVMTRRDDRTLRLRERTDFANVENVDLFISIHCNADPDPDLPGMPEARGEEIFFAPGSAKGSKLADCVADGLRKDFPLEPFRGTIGRELWVVDKTGAPAILVETAFIDNSTSVNELKDPIVRKRIAFAILRGILSYEKLYH